MGALSQIRLNELSICYMTFSEKFYLDFLFLLSYVWSFNIDLKHKVFLEKHDSKVFIIRV